MAYSLRHAVLANLSYDINDDHTGQTLSYLNGESFKIIKVYDDESDTGYFGALIQSGSGELFFVNRGTEWISDGLADIVMGIGRIPLQFNVARESIEDAFQTAAAMGIDPSSIAIIGHSLGGSISQALGAEFGNYTVTFNAYGVEGLLDNIGVSHSSFGNIVNHVLYGDPVSALYGSDFPGSTYAYGEKSHSGSYIFANHSITNFIYENSPQNGEPIEIKKESSLLTNLLEAAFLNKYKLYLSVILHQSIGATPPRRSDPLILDLDGNGIQTVASESGAYFDLDGNGFAERAGWVSPGDGFVVRDLDGNGLIDTGRELFGDQTLMPDGSVADHGFEAIGALDSNNDGNIDVNDEAWSSLRIWKDTNGDGYSSADELISMEDAGVAGVSLAYTSPNTNLGNGNVLAQSGSFTRTDGTTAAAASLLLDRDTTDAVATEWLELPETISGLPDLAGFGNMHHLSQAMVRDEGLATLVQGFVSGGFSGLSEKFDAIMYRWAGADGVAPTSRGSFIDARRLAVVEKFYGQGFVGVSGANPNEVAGPMLDSAYKALAQKFFAQTMAQSHLKPYWEAINFSFSGTGTVEPDFSDVASVFDEALLNDQGAAVNGLAYFVHGLKEFGYTTGPSFGDFQAHFSGSDLALDVVIANALQGVLPRVGSDVGDTISAAGATVGNVFFGLAGNDVMTGGSGADVLIGGDGNDTLDGGKGADVLRGGAGDDILGGAPNGEDAGYYNSGYRTPIAGNTYEGGTGNDRLRGTSMADLYAFNLGDGQDTIEEVEVYGQPAGQVDVLRFGEGLDPADFTVKRVGVDLVISHANGADSVTIKAWYTTPGSKSNQVEQVQFADGTIWSADELTARGLIVEGTEVGETLSGIGIFADTLLGGGGNDVINGGDGNDILEGGDGNDTLDGGRGADILRGGAGDDILGGAPGGNDAGYLGSYSTYYGPGAGNTYEGGTGNDRLRGTSMADLYLFNLGDGQDTIEEVTVSGQPAGQIDTLRFGEGIDPARVRVVQEGNDLVFQVEGTNDHVRVKNWFPSSAYRVERVEFADGSSWDASAIAANTRTVINMQTPNIDLWSQGNSAIVEVNGTNGDNSINGTIGRDVLYGHDGDDWIEGLNGDDWLHGGAGTNYLNGGVGSDTYVFANDGGHNYVSDFIWDGGRNIVWVDPSISPDTIVLSVFDRWSIAMTDTVSQSKMTFRDAAIDSQYSQPIQEIRFADGTVWTLADLRERLVEQSRAGGTDQADALLFAVDSPDGTVDLGDGDDLVVVDSVTATVSMGAGNDTLLASYGTITAFGEEGDDEIEHAGFDYGTGSAVLFGGEGNDRLYASSSINTFIDGGAGNDFISSAGGVVAGGAGDDVIHGADLVLFNRNDGHDRIDGLNYMGGAISLGGFDISELSLARNEYGEFVLHAGEDSIALPWWGIESSTLQLIGFDATGNASIQHFDLGEMVDFLYTQEGQSTSLQGATDFNAFQLDNDAGMAYGGDIAVSHAQSGSLEAIARTRPNDIHAYMSNRDFSQMQVLGGLTAA